MMKLTDNVFFSVVTLVMMILFTPLTAEMPSSESSEQLGLGILDSDCNVSRFLFDFQF